MTAGRERHAPGDDVNDDLDAPEPCQHCTSWRTVEGGSGLDVDSAPILICRRFEAGMCPTMHAVGPHLNEHGVCDCSCPKCDNGDHIDKCCICPDCIGGNACGLHTQEPGRVPDEWVRLRELAEVATPGPWRLARHGIVAGQGQPTDVVTRDWMGHLDAPYIAAADPTTVLALLAEIDRLRAELADLRDGAR